MCSPDCAVSERQPLLKILLAEDNLTNQRLTLRQLQVLGQSADTVANGQAAVDAVRQCRDDNRYDIVLMDCQMPVLDGFGATLAIRTWEQHQPQHSPVVIIAMTASDLEQDRRRAEAIGMNDYLTKPVRKERLAALLNHWSLRLFAANSAPPPTPLVPPSPSPDASSASHLDLEQLHRLSDHTPEFELELLKLFLEDSAVHLKTLQQAVFREDFQQIRQSAHHLKGASASVGATIVQALAEQLETQLYPNQATVTAELIARLEFSLTQVQTFLHKMKNEAEKMSNQ